LIIVLSLPAAAAAVLLQVKRLLARRPEDRPSAQMMLLDKFFQARNTTTQVSIHRSLSF
jgi:hypothetical protein